MDREMHTAAKVLDFFLKGRALNIGNRVYCMDDKFRMCLVNQDSLEIVREPFSMDISNFIEMCKEFITPSDLIVMDQIDELESNVTRH